ncbi:hypothetical protein [Lysobacter sp. F6437]|uniref:hypothetical protein n=1 Tax=Lysobacter sp. F6437 TaxID=3459296 RepID=UPI00403DEB70
MNDSSKKHDVALNVRSTVASYMMYWRKLCLEVSILISSGIVAVSTFGVDKAALSIEGRWGLIIGFGVAAAAGSYLILKASRLIQELRGILVRVDRYDELFVDGAFVPGDSLYPKSWENFDAVGMDFVPKWSIALMAATWVTVSVLLLIHRAAA